MDLSPASRDPMRPPASLALLLGSFVVAFLINLLPWSGTWLLVRPDIVLLVLLYWAVHEPHAIGQGWGFALGLLMDVADSVLLGQHAFVYAAAIFLVQLLRFRMLQMNVFERALHALAILVVAQVISLALNASLGRPFTGWLVFIAPLFTAILWPAVDKLARSTALNRRSGRIIS